MGRGQHFNHKEKGHTPTLSKQAQPVMGKETEKVGYAIEPVASEGDRPVSIKVED